MFNILELTIYNLAKESKSKYLNLDEILRYNFGKGKIMGIMKFIILQPYINCKKFNYLF